MPIALPPGLTPYAVPAAAAVVGLLLGLMLGKALSGAGRHKKRAEELSAKLTELEGRPEQWEARIDRYELLWFPAVTADPRRRVVTAVKPGVPHCRKCVAALSLDRGQWTCAGCGQTSPESIADLMIVDQIGKEAVTQFLQRHPGYTSAQRLS